MKEETRYRYEKTIKSLRLQLDDEREKRYLYKDICSDIYDAICGLEDGRVVGKNWMLQQFRKAWR